MNALLTTLVILLAAPAIRPVADTPAGLQQQAAQRVYSEHGGDVAVVEQSGSGNFSSITQSGGGHRAKGDQSGGARFTVNQSGPPGEIVVKQDGR